MCWVSKSVKTWLAKQEEVRQERAEKSKIAKKALEKMDQDLTDIKNFSQTIQLKVVNK